MPSPTAYERAAAAVLFAVSLPVIAAAAVAIRLTTGQPPFVAHRRIGWRGRPFWMLKLRTLSGGSGRKSAAWVEYLPEQPVPAKSAGPDPRVTGCFAAFCRKYSVDELPQLAHVAAGTMSLVGPRPLTAAELDQYYEGVADEVLSVPPGLSGLWQVMGRNRLTYRQRRRLDLFFVRRRSLRLYLAVLFRTPFRVLTGQNAG